MIVRRRWLLLSLWLLLPFLLNQQLRANVYATDIRLNGSLTSTVLTPGGSVTVSYILNDNATGGVIVQIFSGTNVLKTFSSSSLSTNDYAGTNAGLNTVVWDGTNDTGTNSFQGICAVSITAASMGYDAWTNITDDGPQFEVARPQGIAVNRNTNSPYFGRVFVSATYGPAPDYGICKFNADGSPADEGGFSNGGLSWGAPSDPYSPWKIAITPSDEVCVDDFSGDGAVYGFDQTISPTSAVQVLRADNYPVADPMPQLSGLCITGTVTNEQIWMTDESQFGNSAGIVCWELTNGIVATNDPGTTVVPATNSSPLSIAPYDVDVATNGNIYTIQYGTNADTVMCFPPYAGSPETNGLWAISENTNLFYPYGIAVDPSAQYAAVAIRGNGDAEDGQTNMLNLDLLDAATGQFITNLDETGRDVYTDVAWDAVGNLYAADDTLEVWRAYSPPGPNQSTIIAIPFIQQYPALLAPTLCQPFQGTNGLLFKIQGQGSATYVVQQSSDLFNWIPVLTNFSTNALRRVCIPFADMQDFYRAVTAP